jgi:hypothetical protein
MFRKKKPRTKLAGGKKTAGIFYGHDYFSSLGP